MRLRQLTLTNFRQHADTSIDFGLGITGIIGPNGSGKTTILEAIAWALYGNEAARGKRDSIRFARAEARAPVRVDLQFELGGHTYRVVRGLTSAELYLDGAEQPIANSITSVSEMVYGKLGMSRSEFFNTYFTGQKELTLMATLGPTERAQFLSRVLGYERLRAAQELVREQRRQLIAELSGLRQAMPDPDAVAQAVASSTERVALANGRRDGARGALKHANDALAVLAPRWEAAQRSRAERQQTVADLRLAEHELATHLRDRDRAATDAADAERATAELARLTPDLEPFDALLSERETLDALARVEGRHQTLTDGLRSGEEELALLAERRVALGEAPAAEEAEVEGLEAARRELRDADAAFDAAHTEWVRDRQEAETRREALRSQYAELKAQRERIVEAGEDGICPTCQRPLGANFRGVLDLLDEQLDAVKLDGQYFRGRVEQLEHAPPAVASLDEARTGARAAVSERERRVATVQADVRALAEAERTIARQEQRLAGLRADLATLPSGYDAERHRAVLRELERLEPLKLKVNRLQLQAERGVVARRELDVVTAAVAAGTERVAVLRAAVHAADADEGEFDELGRAHERAVAAAQQCGLEVASADAEARAATEVLARARAAADDLARADARLSTLTRERRMHDELDGAFTDLRTDLNFALRPELSSIASEFLAQLTDNRYTELDLDDQYNLIVVEDGAPKTVISGGEEDLANLVMRLAISQMIAERAGQSFSLLILDEVFGALDESRRQHVIDLLRGLHSRFEQVILITHIEGIRDGCDNVLSVRYDPGSGASQVQSSAPALDAELVGALA